MEWTWFVGLFGLAAGGCLWAARRVLSLYDAEVRRPLVVFLGLTAVWAISNIFLVAPFPASVMHVSYIVGLVVGLATVVAWLWFCSAYAGTPYHYSRRARTLVLGIFALIIAVKLTNPFHGLYFRPAVASEPFRHFAPEAGLLYWLVAALAYIGAAIGLFLLFDMYSSSRVKTTDLTLLTIVIGVPVVPKLLAVVWPQTFLLVFYEPLGAAIFAVGITTVSQDAFLSVRAPARRQLADQLSELVIIVDRQNRIADYNASAERLFGSLDEAVGEPLETVIPQLAAHEDHDRLFELHDGTDERYYVIRTPAVTLGDSTIGQAFVLADVTELEVQRRHLERQAKHMEAVTEELAHQLRNPLTILQGHLELLTANHPSEDSPDGSADTALKTTDRIATIAEDLLSVVTYGKPISETEPLVLKDVIETAIAGDEGPDVAVQFDCKESIRIRGERARCSELFRLIFQTHHARGATNVSVRRSGSQLIISSDGEQFSTESPERLFEYGVETDEDERVQLAHAWTLAEVHGWSIHATGERDTLTILLDGLTFLTDEE